MSLTIEDLIIHNLSTFVINKAKLSLIGPTITADITIPRVYAEGIYNISGKIGNMLDLNGSGPFKADVYDFNLYVNSVLGYSRGMYLKTFYLDFSLSSIDMELGNFMEDEELSRIMSKVRVLFSNACCYLTLTVLDEKDGGRCGHVLRDRKVNSLFIAFLDYFAGLKVPQTNNFTVTV